MNDNNELNQDIDYSRRGPWDSPIPKFVRSKPMKVLIHDLQKETIENEFVLDYGSYEDRKFLGRLTYFALTTGRSVESMSVEEWEKMNQ